MIRHSKVYPIFSKTVGTGWNSTETSVLKDVENNFEYEVKIFQLKQHKLMWFGCFPNVFRQLDCSNVSEPISQGDIDESF